MRAKQLLLVTLVGSAVSVYGDELRINSFGPSGEISWNVISNTVSYSVEWASSLTGPWANSWTQQTDVVPYPTNSTFPAVPVPMFYRIKGDLLGDKMSLIPGGVFGMGDALGDGDSHETPVHDVFISSFLMGKYEVSEALWSNVQAWALSNGYDFAETIYYEQPNDPVVGPSWYDMVKWCNAYSEKSGYVPCYYEDTVFSNVYRTGIFVLGKSNVNWTANGYRLPTEAEWEYAARGGTVSSRFPWAGTNVISHTLANYWAGGGEIYDHSDGAEYHPDFDTGNSDGYESPVGVFPANGYGLHDMAGNVYEWCWDWYHEDYYEVTSELNPRGPDVSSRSARVFRGGSWADPASDCRVAARTLGRGPDYGYWSIGFRVVRNLR